MVEAGSNPYTGSAKAGPSRLTLDSTISIYRPKRRKRSLYAAVLAGLLALSSVHAQNASPGPRWGQAAALFDDHFVVHGGKTNGDLGGGGYAYSGGVNTAELLLLNLDRSFAAASPPWISINSSYSAITSPAIAFHSISPINQGSQLFVFGGDVSSTTSSNLRGNDSAFFLQLNNTGSTAWWQAPTSFNQPERRIHHSADTDGEGALWIVGGERDDGSQIMMNELWSLDKSAASPSFQAQNQPTGGLVGSTASLLSDGTLLVLGGQTSFGLQTFSNVSAFSTKTKSWSTINTIGSSARAIPAPRQGHVAVTLPRRRVLIHGGASLDWSQAMDDTWILDWSNSPPTWSQIDTSRLSPSARFGHSAVARGQKVVFAFGYRGSNPADTNVYIFDASTMTSNKAGFWSGGTWTSTYTPDRPQSITKSGGNGSSNNIGSTVVNSGSDTGSTASDIPPSATSNVSLPPTGSGDPNASNGSETKSGAKAGAAIGALLGVGLIAGAGYMLYRRRHPPPYHYRFGDGSDGAAGGLLRASQHYYGADDDPYMLEKGKEYTGIGPGPGGVASFQQGTRPSGPRIAPSQPELISTTVSMANVGHAMEGSGPHFRERLAMIAGFGRRDATGGRPQRFDMLADEDDYTHDAFALEEKREPIEEEDDYEDDYEYQHMARRMRERSYYGIDQGDVDEDFDRSYVGGDLAGVGAGYSNDYEVSPFEEAEHLRIRDDDSRSMAHTLATDEMHSNTSQSHGNSSKSGQCSSNLVSFSDANDSSRRASNGMSPMIRRSPTWWDRFMGQSFLERSASGRLYPGPRAEEPIRDPAAPPALSMIKESPQSANDVDGNPAVHEMGRFVDPYMDTHSRSLSSLQSNQTMTSSIMEAQLQNMDVVIQRVGTSSSRRSLSTAKSASEDTLSRNSTSAQPGHRHMMTPNETPGSVIFDPNEWSSTQVSHTVKEEQEGNSSLEEIPLDANTSADIAEINYTPVLSTERQLPDRENRGIVSLGMKRSRSVIDAPIRHSLKGRSAKVRELSDAPSLTPSTTKRARQNKQLTAPHSPSPKKTRNAPLQGSVLDRVKAIERRRDEAGEEILPIPRSSAATIDVIGTPGSIYSPEMAKMNMFVPGRGGRPILTRVITATHDNEEAYDPIMIASPIKMKSPTKVEANVGGGISSNKIRYSVGLVPKQQLFVANPDGRQGSG